MNILSDRSAHLTDDGVFAQMYAAAYPKIYATCKSMMRDEDRAHDMTQETFVRAFRCRGSYHGNAAPLTWLTSIAINAVRTDFRKAKHVTTSLDQAMTAHEEGWSEKLFHQIKCAPEQERFISEEFVAKILRQLKPHDRAILLLRHADDKSIEEIMKLTNVPEGTVKIRLFRAKKHFIKAVERSDAAVKRRQVRKVEEWEP